MSGKIIISGTGCALADFLYLNISFHSPEFRKYLSQKAGDGGLSPGRLVFTEELERFSADSYPEILKQITGGAKSVSFNIGGPGLVSMIHAAQMLNNEGFNVRFFGLTGNDAIATQIFSLLSKTPLSISEYRMGSEKSTPFTDVFSDPDYDNGHGERTFVNNIGAAWDYMPENLPDDFFNSHIVCFGGTALVPRIHDGLTGLLKRAKNAGCITLVNTVYDFRNEKANPGGKWPLGNTPESFDLTDILIMDKEEALKISGQLSVEDAAVYFRAHNLTAFVITNGADEITAFSNGSLFMKMPVSTFPVSLKVTESSDRKGDTTGCGDNFAGGLIASVAEQLTQNRSGQLDLLKALSWAVASGGFACFYAGGTWFETFPGEKREKVLAFQQEYLRQLENRDHNE
jgi:sugar/nucleoside kinase (ribokinase family)